MKNKNLVIIIVVIILFIIACNNENDHSCTFGEWIQTTLPTCITVGVKTRACTDCNTQDTATQEGEAALGHDWVDGKCNHCGIEKPEPQIEFIAQRVNPGNGSIVKFFNEQGSALTNEEVLTFVTGLSNVNANNFSNNMSQIIVRIDVPDAFTVTSGTTTLSTDRGIRYELDLDDDAVFWDRYIVSVDRTSGWTFLQDLQYASARVQQLIEAAGF